MRSIRVIIAGGSQTIRVVADAEGVALSNGAFWQQRLTGDEALRVAKVPRREETARSSRVIYHCARMRR